MHPDLLDVFRENRRQSLLEHEDDEELSSSTENLRETGVGDRVKVLRNPFKST